MATVRWCREAVATDASSPLPVLFRRSPRQAGTCDHRNQIAHFNPGCGVRDRGHGGPLRSRGGASLTRPNRAAKRSALQGPKRPCTNGDPRMTGRHVQTGVDDDERQALPMSDSTSTTPQSSRRRTLSGRNFRSADGATAPTRRGFGGKQNWVTCAVLPDRYASSAARPEVNAIEGEDQCQRTYALTQMRCALQPVVGR